MNLLKNHFISIHKDVFFDHLSDYEWVTMGSLCLNNHFYFPNYLLFLNNIKNQLDLTK